MQVTIQEISEVKKTQKGKEYTNLKGDDGKWYNVIGPAANLATGTTVEIDAKPFGKSNALWAQSYEIVKQPKGANNSKLGFWEYMDLMKAAHSVAIDLEPNDGQARAALVDTTLIAVSKGLVAVPEEEPGAVPLPPDDDSPF